MNLNFHGLNFYSKHPQKIFEFYLELGTVEKLYKKLCYHAFEIQSNNRSDGDSL